MSALARATIFNYIFFVNFSNLIVLFFFFNDTATTEIYTLSLHDALPIYIPADQIDSLEARGAVTRTLLLRAPRGDRKSTRLNSSHDQISYAVFCLKKKKNNIHQY